jgi:hypothetical protein
MKTFRKSYVPESIEYKGKIYKLDGEVVAALGHQPKPNSIKLVVTNPYLRGKTDLHGRPYPSSTHYFVMYETPEEKKAREEREARTQERINFWVSMFKPRTKKWCRETLRNLKSPKAYSLENPDEPDQTAHKIEALRRVLSN